MTLLVTGAAGFTGFHLVRALLERGDKVIGVDNINDYYDVNLKYARLAETGIVKESIYDNVPVQSLKYYAYVFIKMDITDRVKLGKLFLSWNVQGFSATCQSLC